MQRVDDGHGMDAAAHHAVAVIIFGQHLVPCVAHGSIFIVLFQALLRGLDGTVGIIVQLGGIDKAVQAVDVVLGRGLNLRHEAIIAFISRLHPPNHSGTFGQENVLWVAVAGGGGGSGDSIGCCRHVHGDIVLGSPCIYPCCQLRCILAGAGHGMSLVDELMEECCIICWDGIGNGCEIVGDGRRLGIGGGYRTVSRSRSRVNLFWRKGYVSRCQSCF